jgi:hypothetical protein
MGCAAGTALIKSPVESKCSGSGLKACGELVDGVLAYVEGDKIGAKLKLKQAAAKNSPGAIRPFAQALKDIVPGEDGKAIAEILSGEVEIHASAPEPVPENPYTRDSQALGSIRTPPSTPPTDEDDEDDEEAREPTARPTPWAGHVELALAAPVDPARLLTGAATPQRDPTKTSCEIAGSHAACVRLDHGPIVVTDAVVPLACRTELYLGASDANGRTVWALQANSPGVHGGRFLLRSDQRLLIAARGVDMKAQGDDRCFVTWAGFRPRMVPQNLTLQGGDQ